MADVAAWSTTRAAEPARQPELADRPDQRGRALHGQHGRRARPGRLERQRRRRRRLQAAHARRPGQRGAEVPGDHLHDGGRLAIAAATTTSSTQPSRATTRRRSWLGTSSAQPITVQFKFKTSVTPASTASRSRTARRTAATYGIITVADTSEHEYSLTLTLDTTGTWLYTNGVGLYLAICLSPARTSKARPAPGRRDAKQTTSAQCNFMSSTSNIAYLKRIQLIPGALVQAYKPADIQKASSRRRSGTLHASIKNGKFYITPWPVRSISYALLFMMVGADAVFNLTIGSIVFLELPKSWMFTTRCSSHLEESGWRGDLARWICNGWLNPFEEGHC
jgi:hypothetical protein